MADRSGKRKNYFGRALLVLKFCGISLTGQETIRYNIYSFIVRYFLVMSYPFVVFGDLNKHGFGVFAQSFPIFISGILANSGLIVLHSNRKQLGKLLNRLQKAPFLANFQRGGDKEATLIREWASSTKKQVLPLYIGAAIVIFFVYLFTLIKRLRSSDSNEWIFVFGPITLLDVTRSPYYEISVLYQNTASSYLGIIVICTINTLSEILAYTCVQFQMLQNNLKTLISSYRRESIQGANATIPSEIPWKNFKKSVRDVVSYHLNILEVVSEVDSIFSTFILMLYITILIVCCFIMYAASLVISVGDARLLFFLLEVLIGFGILLTICYWGEQVAYESEQVARAAYESNFVGSDVRFQKSLNLIIMRSQSPAQIKAGHLFEASMATFAWIVRSSFSYLMVLINLATNE